MIHTVFTFTMAVDPARADELRTVLDAIRHDRPDVRLDFRELPMVHFASIFLFPPDPRGEAYPCSVPRSEKKRRLVPYLVFESNIDGRIAPYVDALLAKFPGAVAAMLRCCADGLQNGDAVALRRYLLAHVVKPGAYHVGTPWRDVQRIEQEARLRDAIEIAADEVVRTIAKPIDPVAAHTEIRKRIGANDEFRWASRPAPEPTLRDKIRPWLPLVPQLPMFVVNALLTILMLPYLRIRERFDCEWKGDVDPKLQEALGAREDFDTQNHMANMSDLKPGFARRTSAKAMLMLASINARLSTKGKLAGIPSIHFAHWALLDGGRRLMFCSNFDGSWENYLDDFIDKASKGLTGLWGGTIGFPHARWLILGGATNGSRFKAIARNKQVPPSVWYNAYRELTVDAIDNNSAIRRDLFATLDADAARAWLRRL